MSESSSSGGAPCERALERAESLVERVRVFERAHARLESAHLRVHGSHHCDHLAHELLIIRNIRGGVCLDGRRSVLRGTLRRCFMWSLDVLEKLTRIFLRACAVCERVQQEDVVSDSREGGVERVGERAEFALDVRPLELIWNSRDLELICSELDGDGGVRENLDEASSHTPEVVRRVRYRALNHALE